MCPVMTQRAEETMPKLAELVIEQTKDVFCREVAGTVRKSVFYYSYYRHCILVCTNAVDGAIETVVPTLVQLSLLYCTYLSETGRTPQQVSYVRL